MKNLTYFTVFAGVALFFIAGHAFAAVDDYTNHYTFDEGTGRNVNDAGGGQHGSFTGTSTGFGWASGQIGTALGMDGMTGESIVLPDGFLSGTQGSLVVWLKMNSLSDRNILFSGQSVNDNYTHVALLVNYEGRPELRFRTTQDGTDQKVQGSGILNKNEWYQLVLTANGVGYHMFINGEEASMSGNNTGKWFSDLTSRVLKYRIGALVSNPLSGVFDGYLDDLRMYSRALTQADVTELYNGGNPGTPDMPLAAKQAMAIAATTAANTAANIVPVTEVTLTAPPAQTQVTTPLDIAGLQAKIQELNDRLLLLKATPSGSNAVIAPFSQNLSVGMRTSDVTRLQLTLIGEGFLAPGLSTGYFGQLTKAALIKFQAKLGLPPTGFFGPMTRAKIEVGLSN